MVPGHQVWLDHLVLQGQLGVQDPRDRKVAMEPQDHKDQQGQMESQEVQDLLELVVLQDPLVWEDL